MSYLVVKQSGSNKSFELKTSVPAKPYMAVKTAVAGTAYLALGTNTTGTGMLVKGANQNYKVVESYTTTINTSSTYNSYYDTTKNQTYFVTTQIARGSLKNSFTANAYTITDRYRERNGVWAYGGTGHLEFGDDCLALMKYDLEGYNDVIYKASRTSVSTSFNSRYFITVTSDTEMNSIEYSVKIVSSRINQSTNNYSTTDTWTGYANVSRYDTIVSDVYSESVYTYNTYSQATSYYTTETTSQ